MTTQCLRCGDSQVNSSDLSDQPAYVLLSVSMSYPSRWGSLYSREFNLKTESERKALDLHMSPVSCFWVYAV